MPRTGLRSRLAVEKMQAGSIHQLNVHRKMFTGSGPCYDSGRIGSAATALKSRRVRRESWSMNHFICNVCCARNRLPEQAFEREAPSCEACGSSVRVRSLLHALSNELLGVSLALPDFPRVRSLRGLGLSDGAAYAERLREKLDYRNTFYDREPRLDLLNPPAGDLGRYDFLLASEIFEHVPPPVGDGFD